LTDGGIFSRYYLARWLLEATARLPPLSATLVKWQTGDVLELDELWSFVLKKSQKSWGWLALCRHTRQNECVSLPIHWPGGIIDL